MRKNVAGQKIGAQMVSATDGSAFTGSVTVYVTLDAGTQATGSVGSGACTHEGNGYHTYAPAQAETNGDLVAFTFTGTGAVPATVQVFTAPTTGFLAPTVADRTLDVSAGGEAGIDWANVGGQSTVVGLSGTTVKTATDVETDTADIQARIGTPANLGGGASVAANLSDIEAQTDDIGVAGAGLTALASAANLATVAGYIDTEIGTIITMLTTIDDFLDTEIAAILTDTGTDIPALIAALNDVSAAEVNAEVVDALATDTYGEVSGVPGATVSLSTMLRSLYGALRNPIDVTSAALTFKNAAGTAQWKKALSDDGSTYSEAVATTP